MRSYIIIIAVIIFFLNTANSKEITAESIIDKFMKSKNFDKLNEINDFHLVYEQMAEPKPMKVDYYYMKENYYRINTTHRGPLTAVYDGEKTWIKPPNMPTIPGNPDMHRQFELIYQIVFTPIYRNLSTAKFEYVGTATVGREQFYHVTMIDSAGTYTELYFDKDTYDLRKVMNLVEFHGTMLPFEMYLDDYVTESDVRIPTKVSASQESEPINFTFKSITFDLGLTQFEFRRPY